MKRSIIPGFIKRKSITSVANLKDDESNATKNLLKEADVKTHQLSAETRYEFQIVRENHGFGLYAKRKISNVTTVLDLDYVDYKQKIDEDNFTKRQTAHRTSVYEGIFCSGSDSNFILPRFRNNSTNSDFTDVEMVDQEDIIALTRHVRNFSDALNNLRNTFRESVIDGDYNDIQCQSSAHRRLSEVLTILKGVLAKYPPLHSPDILTAAANIIAKIKQHNYADGDGPTNFYAAIDQLALSFSSSVSDFLMGDKVMTSPNAQNSTLDQYDDQECEDDDEEEDADEDYDTNFFKQDFENSEKFNASEDSLDRLQSSYELLNDYRKTLPESDENSTSPPARKDKKKHDDVRERTDELDRTLLSIEGSVDIALQRTKVWAKYAKDILNYIERRSHLELEFSRSTAKLASQTRSSIMEESYLPFQSIYLTALENDVQFANNYHKSCQNQLQQIIDNLTQRQREHDIKRSKIKTKWKVECKRLHKSRENLRAAKEQYLQKQKDLEKYNKQSEGKDDKGFSLGKKKAQVDLKKSAEESETFYKQCVDEANTCQHEIEQTKTDVLLELRQLVYHCDLTMKSITVAYFRMMNNLLSPLPIQYSALEESSNLYEEGQQFADFVRLQQSTCNQAMCPTYHFESYRGEGADKFNNIRHGNSSSILALSSEDFAINSNVNNLLPPRRSSFMNSEIEKLQLMSGSPGGSRKVRQAWGTLPRNKGSATDDTDSMSSRSLPASPGSSPVTQRQAVKTTSNEYSDDDHSELKDVIVKNSKQTSGFFKNQKLSAAAKMHKFRKLRAPSKCKECDSYVYFNGAECETCGIICHKKCLEKLAIKCGNKRLPRKMTTFGVDFHQHLIATKRKDIPYIIEKCIDCIDDNGLTVKGIYRVSGVKSKVEKLCQQFETGGDLVDLSNTPPHFVACVLKLYLRQLPEPLLTFKLYHRYIKIAKDSQNLKLSDLDSMNDKECSQYENIISELHQIVKQLPDANYFTAAKLIRHLKRVSESSDENQMTEGNLAIVFGPTLLRPEGNPNSLAAVMDMSLQTRAVEVLILNSHIFSVDDENGEVEIEITAGECTSVRPLRQPKKSLDKQKRQPNSIQEHEHEDSVSSEFSQELMFMMESSQKRMDEDRVKAEETSPGQLPGQAIDYAYDNLPNEKETDILTDLPADGTKQSLNLSMSLQSETNTDYESCHSRLNSIESLLSGDTDVDSTSPVKLPDSSAEHNDDIDDDDVWMNRFGQLSTGQQVEKPRSASSGDIRNGIANGLMQKKLSFGKLETTTYSFSLGNSSKENPTDVDRNNDDSNPTSPGSDDSMIDAEPSVWVKRDGRERVPVRKHLKTVNIKSTTHFPLSLPSNSQSSPLQKNKTDTVLDEQSFLKSLSLKENNTENKIDGDENARTRDRISSTASTDSEADNQTLLLRVAKASKQLREVPEGGEPDVPTSPSKTPPTVLPKPRKTLDKKSWTADLIKNKSQTQHTQQPPPGSLNDKLLHDRHEEKPDEIKPSVSKQITVVNEAHTAFRDPPSLSSDNDTKKKSGGEVVLNNSENNSSK